MARKSNNISREEIVALRKLVKTKSTTTIQNPVDCKMLSSEVFSITGEYISDSTLKRFLGFVKSPFTPSYDTVRILKQFVGHAKEPAEESYISFITDFFKPLHFKEIQREDLGFQAACRSIALHLRKQPHLFEKVMTPLAQSETGRRFYYDLFPDLEILCDFQYKGYEQFLIYEKRYEGKLYAHCVLFLKYYFEKDHEGMLLHYQAVNSLFKKSKPLHPYVLGRFYQVSLMYAALHHPRKISKLITDIITLEKKQSRKEKDLFRDFPCFHYYVSDGLFHTGQFETLAVICERALKDFPKTKEFIWKGYYEQLRIYMAYALLHTDRRKEAEKMAKTITTVNFYFISKAYFEGLYKELMRLLNGLR